MILVKNLKFLPSLFVCLYVFIGLDILFDDVLNRKTKRFLGCKNVILTCVCFSLNQALYFLVIIFPKELPINVVKNFKFFSTLFYRGEKNNRYIVR